jgi:predicted cation transporter
MSLCAVALSRSWRLDIVEETVREPLFVGAVLIILLAGSILRYRRLRFEGLNHYLLDGITLKVIFFEIVVVLGLFASVITPILPFFVLVEVMNHLPFRRETRAKLTILAGFSICLGAAMALIEEPYSTLCIVKMQGMLPPASFLPLELQNLYLILCILALGFVSIFLAEEKVTNVEMRTLQGEVPLKNVVNWSARVCMFAAAILLVGVAFGANF